jgi:hypothetical protein
MTNTFDVGHKEGRDTMPLWRIHSVAHPEDSRWQGRRIWAEVIVQAESAAFARLMASKLDEPPVPHRLGNESLCFRSGFEDEKLYWVHRLSAVEAARYDVATRGGGVIVALPLADDAGEAESMRDRRASRFSRDLTSARELEGLEQAA